MTASRNKLAFLFLALAACFSAAPAQERRLPPIDEARRDASFASFRQNLIRAVEKRDSKFVLSIVARDVKNGFAGEDGIENFKKQWKLNDPQSPLWNELMFVLVSGGAFEKGAKNKTFWAPYVYSNFPENLDPFDHAAVIAPSVKLLARPSGGSHSVGTLSYSLVKVDYNGSVKDKANPERYVWVKVETFGGKKGFVPAKVLRSSVDYRAAFEKTRDGWKMTVFLAGD